MERLTRMINGVVVYVGAKNPYSPGQIPCEVEPAGVREMMYRLAAYEDTHMMPSDVTSMRMDMAIIAALFNGVDVDRMKELAEADKDGRLVVRPFRIDAAVYVLVKDEAVFYPETNGWYIGTETIGAITQDGFYLGDPEEGCFETNDEIGKTVFLTSEEAKKALEEKSND